MYRSTRIISAVAIVASALALAPAAYADPPYGDATSVGDTTGVGLMYASTVKGPTTADTTGAGILHASMVDAARRSSARSPASSGRTPASAPPPGSQQR
jgi:hypothetical protein